MSEENKTEQQPVTKAANNRRRRNRAKKPAKKDNTEGGAKDENAKTVTAGAAATYEAVSTDRKDQAKKPRRRNNQKRRGTPVKKDGDAGDTNESTGDKKETSDENETSKPENAQNSTPSPQKPKNSQRRKGRGKKAGRNTESFDPKSTMVRPALRVQIGSAADKQYAKLLKSDDVVIVPEMFGKEEDLSIYEKLVSEIKQLQADKVEGAELTPWHQGAHMIVQDPKESKTFQEIVDKLCEYFHVKKDSIYCRLNWYQNSKDWKPFHHDSAAYNAERAKTQNITVGVSFGACRELVFLKTKPGDTTQDQSTDNATGDDVRIYFPQPNNGVFTFGRDVNIKFKHGINAIPEKEQNDQGRISIIVWGLATNVAEDEAGSPNTIGDNGVKKEGNTAKKEGELTERQKKRMEKRREQRKAWRKKKAEDQRAAKAAKRAVSDDQGSLDGEIIEA